MATTPVTVNPISTIVNSAISAALQGGEVAIQAAITAEVPFLGLPIISTVFGWALSYVEGYFYTYTADAVTKLVIDIQVNSEESVASQTFSYLQTAIASGDPNAISAASTALDSAYAGLINYDGSASP
jgi:hypothetical protein